jgi:glycosyltransferase involved in cell wall biosynthesis
MPGTPSVVFIHDPKPHPDLTGWVYAKLEQSSIRQAKRCIILSKNLVDEMIKRGASPEQIDVIPLGPYSNHRNPELIPLRRDIPTLLFFGRVVLYKGLDILLQAYAELRKTHQACLVIAGEGDLRPYQSMLKNLTDVKIINQWIPEDEIETLFIQSDILVLPYTSASQSGVIPIAASVGLPVIATRTGGVPEQIEDGKSGWLVQPGSKEALLTAITEALDHPDLARQRGEALRVRYESLFNWEKVAHQVAESLKKAVHPTGPK